MNILWFSWKDEGHPLAGGAEVVSGELRRQLINDGHTVRLVTAQYGTAPEEETIGGVMIYRMGGRLSVYWRAFRFFRKSLRSWPDLVVDEMNTIPFGCAFYTNIRTVLLTYQLARRVWFYQLTFPFSVVGYLLEPIYLFVLSRKYRLVLTESKSTQDDLVRFGFARDTVHIFRIGYSLQPLSKLESKRQPTQVLSLGAVRPMKRTLHVVKGFERARDNNPELRLVLAGDTQGAYARRVIAHVHASRHAEAIMVLGRVSSERRLELMRESAVIVVTSIKEGWGLIITEAASQGTPAVAYDVDGLRDSIQNQKTGLLVPAGDTRALGDAINRLLADVDSYSSLRNAAWEWSKEFSFVSSYKDFCNSVLPDRRKR